MIFKDVIDSVEIDKVREKFISLYPDYVDNVDKYMDVLKKLKEMEPQKDKNSLDMVVAVDYYEPEFDEDEVVGSYRVHGFDENSEISYFWAIEYSEWSKWLGWKADKRYISIYGKDAYVSHCLWEMTYGGFTEDEIQGKVDDIKGRDEENNGG